LRRVAVTIRGVVVWAEVVHGAWLRYGRGARRLRWRLGVKSQLAVDKAILTIFVLNVIPSARKVPKMLFVIPRKIKCELL
jgi:hypothetical protein